MPSSTPTLMPHTARQWIVVLSALSIGALVVAIAIALCGPVRARMNQAQIDCKQRLVRAAALLRGSASRNAKGEPSPIDSREVSAEWSDPVISYLTNGRIKAPIILVYGVQRRDTQAWEYPTSVDDVAFPVAFVSETLGQPGGIGEGLIYYSNGVVRTDRLPLLLGDVIIREKWPRLDCPIIEIRLNNGCCPYSRVIMGMRAQYLGVPGKLYRENQAAEGEQHLSLRWCPVH